jgi:hypothetical protein
MIRPNFPVFTVLTSAAAALFFQGCDKPQIRVYTVAKDAPPATPPPAAAAAASADPRTTPSRPRPQVKYTLPPGWEEGGSNSLSLVNFRIKSEAGEATVNITPLAGMQGREAAIVNMWRSQVGQPALNDQDVAKGFTPVEVAGGSGQLFEVTGAREGDNLRIVTAFVHRGDESWFYKLQGSDAVVVQQKPVFLEFLKTVKIEEGSAATAGAAPSGRPTPKWTVPEGWQTVAPGQMQIAKFNVPAVDAAKAEVAVSVFPSDTGGTLANVNRWRKQLGLDEIQEAALKEYVRPMEGVEGAQLVELANGERRMLSAVVPREGTWWFYKMMGDAPAVNAARDAFVRFAQSTP